MLALDIANPLQFDFIDAPDEMTMARAISTLFHLAAIDAHGAITELGRKMAKFPVNPRMARCLLAATDYDCVFEMVSIAAMLENVGLPARSRTSGSRRRHTSTCPATT